MCLILKLFNLYINFKSTEAVKIFFFFHARMVEFFQKMKEFAEICNVENSVTESLNELKKTFCISSAIFFKFKR